MFTTYQLENQNYYGNPDADIAGFGVRLRLASVLEYSPGTPQRWTTMLALSSTMPRQRLRRRGRTRTDSTST
jgi:hypothetical protein